MSSISWAVQNLFQFTAFKVFSVSTPELVLHVVWLILIKFIKWKHTPYIIIWGIDVGCIEPLWSWRMQGCFLHRPGTSWNICGQEDPWIVEITRVVVQPCPIDLLAQQPHDESLFSGLGHFAVPFALTWCQPQSNARCSTLEHLTLSLRVTFRWTMAPRNSAFKLRQTLKRLLETGLKSVVNSLQARPERVQAVGIYFPPQLCLSITMLIPSVPADTQCHGWCLVSSGHVERMEARRRPFEHWTKESCIDVWTSDWCVFCFRVKRSAWPNQLVPCRYFQSLARSPKQVGGDARRDASETMKHVVNVHFSLDNLLEFKHSIREFGDLQEYQPKNEERRCRKRPNYDNSKRAFYAKGRPPSHQELLRPIIRKHFLVCMLHFSFSCLGVPVVLHV